MQPKYKNCDNFGLLLWLSSFKVDKIVAILRDAKIDLLSHYFPLPERSRVLAKMDFQLIHMCVSVCVCECVCVWVCVWVCVCECVCECVCMCAWKCEREGECVCLRDSVCVSVWKRGNVCVWMFECEWERECVNVCVSECLSMNVSVFPLTLNCTCILCEGARKVIRLLDKREGNFIIAWNVVRRRRERSLKTESKYFKNFFSFWTNVKVFHLT